jgi:hypothetical protein
MNMPGFTAESALRGSQRHSSTADVGPIPGTEAMIEAANVPGRGMTGIVADAPGTTPKPSSNHRRSSKRNSSYSVRTPFASRTIRGADK